MTSNERIDVYRNIHKGIRFMLFELVNQSGRADFTDAAALASLRAKVHDVFELLASHAHNEDEFIMPLVRDAAPKLAEEFAAVHEDQEAQLPGLLALLDSIDASAPDAEAKGHAFAVQLSRVAGELLVHMADEELQLNPALWAAKGDAEIHDAEQRLVGSIPPPKMERYLRWMLPAMNPAERASFLGVLPPPVFAFVRELASKVLTPAEDAALERALAVGA
ncbi:MAG TPA: hemerythrin domain-containing protein [Thermoanaerobaculia bacterium]|nr:hemerythrin domain-containing protein [Thermoanaerobaculia bacterium]